MKYLGEKSLSSLFSLLLNLSWYLIIFVFIIGLVFGVIFLFFTSTDAQCMIEIAKGFQTEPKCIVNLPVILKILILVYFSVVIVLTLQILKKSHKLFNNFKNNIVFNKSNVFIISKISKLLIVYAVLTFDFSTLLVSILMLILCEIFKNGTALQEEHDLTI